MTASVHRVGCANLLAPQKNLRENHDAADHVQEVLGEALDAAQEEVAARRGNIVEVNVADDRHGAVVVQAAEVAVAVVAAESPTRRFNSRKKTQPTSKNVMGVTFALLLAW